MDHAIIIGAGQAGLTLGYFLQQHDVPFRILDAKSAVGGSWPRYYDSLKLYSPARYSQLPGLPFPGDPDRYPTRDETIAYLQRYAQTFDLPVQLNTRVTGVARDGDGFVVATEAGETLRAPVLVSATGPHRVPYVPQIANAGSFTGRTLHSFDYDNPQGYEGEHVVVVGSRDSAMQIAVDLAPVARVTMAVRHELKFFPRTIWGKDLFFWLHETGYDRLPLANFGELHGTDRIVGEERYTPYLKAGNPTPRAMFERFTENGVVWPGGETEAVDTVIYATGFKPGLGYLAPLGALDENGKPCHKAGVSERVPGLFFMGLFGQRSHASATLRGVGDDGRIIAGKIAAYLRHTVFMG